MRTFLILPALMLATALVSIPTAFADDEAVYAKLIPEKATSVVSVKLVLAVKITSPRGSQEQEITPPRRVSSWMRLA